MIDRPREETQVHTRLLKCALEVNDCRQYWTHAVPGHAITPKSAFDEYLFGARSLTRIEVLLSNMRARFDAYPAALEVLHRWPHMSPDTRRLICHWHLQLADPVYRRFTGEFLVARRADARGHLGRDVVIRWIAGLDTGRWTMATRIQFASKLLSAAYSAGLVATNRDPRPIVLPRLPDDALEYALYLLRDVTFEGDLRGNPYLKSVGLEGVSVDERLRLLPSLNFARQAELVDYGWHYENLLAWADVRLGLDLRLAGIR
jgi:hypothetical protein